MSDGTVRVDDDDPRSAHRGRRAGEPVAALSPTETALWQAWGRARNRLARHLTESMEGHTGLSMAEFAVLTVLCAAPEHRARLSDVADHCGLSPSRISRLADGLIRRGLARRERDGSDRRGSLLALTDKGEERRGLADAHKDLLARHYMLDHVPVEHLDLFLDVIGTMSRVEPPSSDGT